MLLHDAMEGWGTNEDTLIDVLTGVNWKQRKDIEVAYADMFRANLVDDIKDETSSDFRSLLVSLLSSPAELDAKYV